ncbi:MAG: ABC transporter substrate-binding protein [Rhizobacter sp.]|nr:ABC transporter substrate-binding protein [Chlorobiales bacterium]
MLGDADNMNPIISQISSAADIWGLLFLRLTKSSFDTASGALTYKPSLATRWQMSPDNKSITYTMRTDAKWSDGKPITPADVKFSYELYGDTAIGSVRQQHLSEFVKDAKGNTDFDQAMVITDTTITFNFDRPLSESLALFQTNLTPVPKHIWETVPRKEIRNSPYNSTPVTAGFYTLKKWTRQSEVILESNPTWNVPAPGKTPLITYRIIPEYTTRLTQLKTNAIDLTESITPADARPLEKENPNLKLRIAAGRAYDQVAWSNIDHELYNKTGKVKPHPLFGSKKVRQALTFAIDRQSIIEGFLGKYGRVAVAPISPAFKWAYNDALTPYPFDPEKAKALLKEEGWKIGSGGILEKNGKKFSFSLVTNSGNPRRNYAATIVQQNLKNIGIECNVELSEAVVFFGKMRKREYDACLTGYQVGLQIDLKDAWGSDLKKSQFNSVGFQNKRIDELMAQGGAKLNAFDAAAEWKELQAIIHEEQPVTYLYWINPIHGFNRRITGEEVNIFGAQYNVEEWSIDQTLTEK